jgi:hypothetical protein
MIRQFRSSARFVCITLASLFCLISSPAQAIPIGGVEFPQGLISFADAVDDFSPAVPGPTDPHLGAFNALGAPNFAGTECTSQADCTYVTLGDGGSITLRFINNRLTGSGNANLDLWIFEIGPDVEDTFVEISKDGVTWSAVGKVSGATAGVNIDAFGFGVADQFAYVRLRDDPDADAQGSGGTVGADIDAVGAISTVRVTDVPLPATGLLMLAGLLPLAGLRRRRA